MNVGNSWVEVLGQADIVGLTVGDLGFRRRVKRRGIDDLVSLLSMADDEIDDLLEPAYADFVIDMKESFERDPEGFARDVMGGRGPRLHVH